MKLRFIALFTIVAPFLCGSEIKWNIDTATAFDLTITGGLGNVAADGRSASFYISPIPVVSDSGLWSLRGGNSISVHLDAPYSPIWAFGGGTMYYVPYYDPATNPWDYRKSIYYMGYTDPNYTLGTSDIVAYDLADNRLGEDYTLGVGGWQSYFTLTVHRPIADDLYSWTWDAHVWGWGPDLTPHVPDDANTAPLLLASIAIFAFFRRRQT